MSDTPQIPVATTMSYKGKTYRMEPPGVGDYEELGKHLRDKYMDEASEQIARNKLPKELAFHAWEVAKKESDKIRIGTTEFDAAAQSLEGMSYMLWLSLRKTYPEVSFDFAKEIIADEFYRANAFKKINGFVGEAVNPTVAAAEIVTA